MKDFKEYIVQNHNIISCFYYGSRVYGTNKENSDFDFIVVVNKKEDILSTTCVKLRPLGRRYKQDKMF